MYSFLKAFLVLLEHFYFCNFTLWMARCRGCPGPLLRSPPSVRYTEPGCLYQLKNENTPKNAKKQSTENQKNTMSKYQLKGAQFLHLACQGVGSPLCPLLVTSLMVASCTEPIVEY